MKGISAWSSPGFYRRLLGFDVPTCRALRSEDCKEWEYGDGGAKQSLFATFSEREFTLSMEWLSAWTFYIRDVYSHCCRRVVKVLWWKLVLNSAVLPEWVLCFSLLCLMSLGQRKGLERMGIIDDYVCVLRDLAPKTRDHLFVLCPYMVEVRATTLRVDGVMSWMGSRSTDWWMWVLKVCVGKTRKVKIRRVLSAVLVYEVWRERNYRIFECESLRYYVYC
ncbi:hypothetical protein Dimus_007402 [Dionaea muscipula]